MNCFDRPAHTLPNYRPLPSREPEDKHYKGLEAWQERNQSIDDDGDSGDLYEDNAPDMGDYEQYEIEDQDEDE
jgi:hypothetical protein